MKILLTIGIPTYNGGNHIKKTIDRILEEIRVEDYKRIEVLVVDNFSTDNMIDILKKYKENYPSIFRYIRNDMNIGYDRNVNEVMKKSHGKYVWIFGDDDIILENSINKVLKVLETKKEYGILYTGKITKGRLKEDSICYKGEDFLIRTNFGLGGISCNIINKNSWENVDVEKYFDSEWIHFGVALEILKTDKMSYIFSEMLQYEDENIEKRWGTEGEFLFTGLKLVTIFSKMKEMGYSKKIIEKAYNVIRGNYPKILIVAKIKGLKVDKKLIYSMITLYKKFILFWLRDLPLLLIPSNIYTISYNLYRKAKK